MNPIHAIWAGIAFLLWSSHQHVQAILAGHTLYSGSLLGGIAIIFFVAVGAFVLYVIRSIVREFGPAPRSA